MQRGWMQAALAIALMVLGGTAMAQYTGFNPAAGGSRAAAIQTENDRYADQQLGFRMRRRQNSAECSKKLQKAHGDAALVKQAKADLDKANEPVTDDEIDAARIHGDNLDRIARYWDKQRNDAGRTNRIDGRDGLRYTDKVPRPNLQTVYPTRYSRGDFQVRLPNGTWVPAQRGPNGNYIPR